MRPESLGPNVGQRPAADTALPRSGKQHRARNIARGRIRRGRREIAPSIVEAGRRQIDVVPQAEVQHELIESRASRPAR